jgi:hypothetical protein
MARFPIGDGLIVLYYVAHNSQFQVEPSGFGGQIPESILVGRTPRIRGAKANFDGAKCFKSTTNSVRKSCENYYESITSISV